MTERARPRLVVLSGAGISAESGIKTFRDADGLWEGHDVMTVASPQGWRRDPQLVLAFYNARRRQLFEVTPNAAHVALAALEHQANVVVEIITQNVDDLHERAGSAQVMHLHGELRKARSTANPELVYDWDGDLALGDVCERGAQLRPHIVWFGEEVPLLANAERVVRRADAVLVVGSSMQVYPAAGLVACAPARAAIYYVDRKPTLNDELRALQRQGRLTVVAEPASTGVPRALAALAALPTWMQG